MTTTLQWHGDRLLPGEHCESHLVEFRNVIELDDSGAYRHPNDHANVALRNAVDEEPGSRAVKLLMLSLDRDLCRYPVEKWCHCGRRQSAAGAGACDSR